MNEITHRYIVSKQLLEELEKYIEEKREIGEITNIDQVLARFRYLKLRYNFGLSKLR